MKKYDISLIGLGIMGQSLARNFASRKIKTLVYNRHVQKTQQFLKRYGNSFLEGRKELKSLTNDLKSPRKILLMVPAGKPVDDMIKKLSPYLKKGDILIDGGNSLFSDTIRRSLFLKKKGIHFVGMGVSGGEEGALRGPSIMPGGDAKAVRSILPILKKIAAKDFKGGPCVTNIGEDGAGHFVKMMHNGIEYAVMQMMAEAYDLLKKIYGLSADEIATLFTTYNRGKLKSFLFEIAVPVLRRKDEFKKGNLIDFILDKAAQKGTGRWTVIDGMERGTTIPVIAEAVFARSFSAARDQRVKLNKLYQKSKPEAAVDSEEFAVLLEDALYAGIITVYAQGFEHIRLAADDQKWKIDFAEVTRIWQGGCIIRAELLAFLHRGYKKSNHETLGAGGKPPHVFEMSEIKKALLKNTPALRQIVSLGALSGIPIPCMATSLNYFDAMTSDVLPANFIQGLRDFFGAHTYERTDRQGTFHTPWSDLTL